MDPETSKKVYHTFNRSIQTGIPAKAFDWELIRKDGTKRILETSYPFYVIQKVGLLDFMGSDVTLPSVNRQKRSCARRSKDSKPLGKCPFGW